MAAIVNSVGTMQTVFETETITFLTQRGGGGREVPTSNTTSLSRNISGRPENNNGGCICICKNDIFEIFNFGTLNILNIICS